MNFQQADKWIDLGDWGTEMDVNKLPPSDDLAGKEIELLFQGTQEMRKCIFLGANSLLWETEQKSENAPSEELAYEAIEAAPGVYFVDFVSGEKSNISNSLVLDFSTGKVTTFTATIPGLDQGPTAFITRLKKGLDLSEMEVHIQHALLNPSSRHEPVPVHERTSELVGKRVQYTYGASRIYEHVYLNDHLFTWHCLEGVEKGLADTEYCDYFKIAPDVYLFSWREKIMPTFGLVVIDLKDMRSNGKTFGFDIGTGNYMNFMMGAKAHFLNETTYKLA